jgi:hypothetical protein
MPRFLQALSDRFTTMNAERINHFGGFTEAGAMVPGDSRGTRRAEIPEVSEQAFTFGDDSLAIYKSTIWPTSPVGPMWP